MCHGTHDDVVNYSWGQASCKLLQENGINVDFRSYKNMGHSASQEELMDVLQFMKTNLSEF